MARYLAFVLVACSPSHPAPSALDAEVTADSTAAGDAPSSGPQVEIMYRSRDGMPTVCAPSAPVPLMAPPQGGLILPVGVRAKRLDLSNLMLTASIRDPVDNQLLSVEGRPVQLVVGADGWAIPDQPDTLFNWSNLPACPIQTAAHDLFDQPYVLRVAVEDATGAKAEAKLTIVPACEPGSAGDLCRCQCKHGYRLGDPCP